MHTLLPTAAAAVVTVLPPSWMAPLACSIKRYQGVMGSQRHGNQHRKSLKTMKIRRLMEGCHEKHARVEWRKVNNSKRNGMVEGAEAGFTNKPGRGEKSARAVMLVRQVGNAPHKGCGTMQRRAGSCGARWAGEGRGDAQKHECGVTQEWVNGEQWSECGAKQRAWLW